MAVEENGYVVFAMSGVKIVFIRGWVLGLSQSEVVACIYTPDDT